MKGKLLVIALVALSVSKLETALVAEEYSADELKEAIDLESAGQNRSTAIEALEKALEDASTLVAEPQPEPTGKCVVCKGKSITTRAGIKVGGEEIKEGMLPATSVTQLLEKNYLEILD